MALEGKSCMKPCGVYLARQSRSLTPWHTGALGTENAGTCWLGWRGLVWLYLEDFIVDVRRLRGLGTFDPDTGRLPHVSCCEFWWATEPPNHANSQTLGKTNQKSMQKTHVLLHQSCFLLVMAVFRGTLPGNPRSQCQRHLLNR